MIGVLVVFFTIAYGVGTFIFIMFPKTFEPFVNFCSLFHVYFI